jgi:hypothetical protein
LRLPLRSEDLIRLAQRSSGLVDFGEAPFRAGLDAFLRACNDEAGLSLFGYFGTRWDVRRFLTNLLRLRYEEQKAPEILDEPIEKPLFIMGMPRSGTTFLHRVLACDEANRAPQIWEPIHPYRALNDRGRNDRRRQRVSRQLQMFAMLTPEFKRMHPVEAVSPQECSDITAHVFISPRFDTTYSIPSYRSWLTATGQLDAYRFHKRFLQHLQHQQKIRRRWVLKCPEHIFALEALKQIYPDARVVFVHRDPLDVVLSVARLTEVLRTPFSKHIDRSEIGRHEEEIWGAAGELMIGVADREPFAEPICHIQFRDLVGDTFSVLEDLYRHFNLVLESETVARVTRMLEQAPRAGYGANRYSFDTYGFDRKRLQQRFAPYVERFAIPTTRRPYFVEFSRRAVAG